MNELDEMEHGCSRRAHAVLNQTFPKPRAGTRPELPEQ